MDNVAESGSLIAENSADVPIEQNHENSTPQMSIHGVVEPQHDFSEEEIKGTLEISASTGKFWQDWEKLKSMISYHLKKVLSEYPEAKMTTEQQTSLLGETFLELVKRLDDALCSFDEGPPFTLQRLCEILLSASNIYPKLSKLALALEKNLLVTSTLTISEEPHPPTTIQKLNGSYERPQDPHPQTESVENGVQPTIADTDEVMAEGEQTEVHGAGVEHTEVHEAAVEQTEVHEAGVEQTEVHEAEVEQTEVHEEMMVDRETTKEVVRSSEANISTGHS